ncbi:uncharacterized protein LOC142521946 [Primulina tabacum]|uniref:uncharacterized protein LOC142521946 n=1 Tax=Primulina tabacum TaxID=48773 RepID=UPI003F5927AE
MGFMSQSIGKQLGDFIGRFIEYDDKNKSSLWRSYMRIRVDLDVRKPLKSIKKIKKAGDKFCEVLFEASNSNLTKEWGTWLRAIPRRLASTGGERWLRDDKGDAGIQLVVAKSNNVLDNMENIVPETEGNQLDENRELTMHDDKKRRRDGLRSKAQNKVLDLESSHYAQEETDKQLHYPKLPIPILCELIKAHKADVVFLSETLVHAVKVEEIRVKVRFADMEIDTDNISRWRLTSFYGFHDRGKRSESWALLRSLSSQSTLPWCIIGDFNDLLSPDDKKGKHEHPQWLYNGFRQAVMDSGLSGLPLIVYPFTWARGKGTTTAVEERLDRALVTPSWMSKFPSAQFHNFCASVSDHSPILINTTPRMQMDIARDFMFENKWLKEPDLQPFITSIWETSAGGNIMEKLESMSTKLAEWGRKKNRIFKDDIEQCKKDIERLRVSDSEENALGIQKIKHKLTTLITQEELHWKQRAKEYWLKDEDLNTQYFQSVATQRKERNRIKSLVDDNGETAANYEPVTQMVDRVVSDEVNDMLTAPFEDAEFKQAIFQMKADKSPGPDGFNPGFFQKFWKLVGSSVIKDCKMWLSSLQSPPKLNNTTVVLIPKCESPISMTDLRPISLCNVLYNLIAKVLANQMKGILPHIISIHQSAFTKGRAITDNVILAFETVHSMNRKTKGKNGDIALKIDFSKAYDRIDWGFLKAIMLKMGFCNRWVNYIMLCITSVSYTIKVNNIKVGPISAKRDIEECNQITDILQAFEAASGQMINLHKSGIMFSRNVPTGFPNLNGFNLAMLGKQGWNILSNPNTLVSQVLKAKYYPDKDFLKAALANGNYSVKSGYHLAMNIIDTDRANNTTGAWAKLWDLNMRPKVKAFAWRMVRNWLPTRINLQNKRLLVPSNYVNCNSMLEQPWHLFYTCQFAQDCWEISSVKIEVNSTTPEIENFDDWFFNILESLDVA